jgi:hypothetical protein
VDRRQIGDRNRTITANGQLVIAVVQQAPAEEPRIRTEAGLVRVGDLIGQLGDPLYPCKLNALYPEVVETGVHEKLGYTSPADMVDRYPQFY